MERRRQEKRHLCSWNNGSLHGIATVVILSRQVAEVPVHPSGGQTEVFEQLAPFRRCHGSLEMLGRHELLSELAEA